jgi:hypothetical protein
MFVLIEQGQDIGKLPQRQSCQPAKFEGLHVWEMSRQIRTAQVVFRKHKDVGGQGGDAEGRVFFTLLRRRKLDVGNNNGQSHRNQRENEGLDSVRS